MKRCSYCGAEYPDEAVMCGLDQTPLGSSNPGPVPVQAKQEVPEEIPPRPNAVKLAMGCLAGSFVVSLLQMVAKNDFRQIVIGYQAAGFVIALFLVCMIYERKNWVRWLIAGFSVLWLVSLAFHFRFLKEENIFGDLLFAVQLILWVAAPFMLFTQRASEWFRRSR